MVRSDACEGRELERLSAGMYGRSCAEHGQFAVGKIVIKWLHLPFQIFQGLLSTMHPNPSREVVHNAIEELLCRCLLLMF